MTSTAFSKVVVDVLEVIGGFVMPTSLFVLLSKVIKVSLFIEGYSAQTSIRYGEEYVLLLQNKLGYSSETSTKVWAHVIVTFWPCRTSSGIWQNSQFVVLMCHPKVWWHRTLCPMPTFQDLVIFANTLCTHARVKQSVCLMQQNCQIWRFRHQSALSNCFTRLALATGTTNHKFVLTTPSNAMCCFKCPCSILNHNVGKGRHVN